MPGDSSWLPYAPQGVKGFDDDDDGDDDCVPLLNLYPLIFGLTHFGWLCSVTLTSFF